MGLARYQRNAWEDQFKRPTEKELRDAFSSRHNASLFEQTLAAFRERPGLKEQLAWHGVPWCWSYVFTNGKDDGVPAAMVIPDAQSGPKVVVPMPPAVVTVLTSNGISPEARFAIDHSRGACGSAWPQFDITGKAKLEAVVSLVQQRLSASPGGAKRH